MTQNPNYMNMYHVPNLSKISSHLPVHDQDITFKLHDHGQDSLKTGYQQHHIHGYDDFNTGHHQHDVIGYHQQHENVFNTNTGYRQQHDGHHIGYQQCQLHEFDTFLQLLDDDMSFDLDNFGYDSSSTSPSSSSISRESESDKDQPSPLYGDFVSDARDLSVNGNSGGSFDSAAGMISAHDHDDMNIASNSNTAQKKVESGQQSSATSSLVLDDTRYVGHASPTPTPSHQSNVVILDIATRFNSPNILNFILPAGLCNPRLNQSKQTECLMTVGVEPVAGTGDERANWQDYHYINVHFQSTKSFQRHDVNERWSDVLRFGQTGLTFSPRVDGVEQIIPVRMSVVLPIQRAGKRTNGVQLPDMCVVTSLYNKLDLNNPVRTWKVRFHAGRRIKNNEQYPSSPTASSGSSRPSASVSPKRRRSRSEVDPDDDSDDEIRDDSDSSVSVKREVKQEGGKGKGKGGKSIKKPKAN